jgi:ribonuclease III
LAGESYRTRLRALLARAGVRDGNLGAFEGAFVHDSAVSERLAERSNERLEFLGDSILGFVVARSLFERYREANEGELGLRKAALVSDAAIAQTAERLGFGQLLVMGASLAKEPAPKRRSSLGDAFEAFLAVLYRECGVETVALFVQREHIEPFELAGAELVDPKTVLQEWTQRRFGTMPAYADRSEGPDHERIFFAEVSVTDEVRAEGSGPSKKTARRAAAAQALALLGERYDDVAPRTLSAPSAIPTNAGAPSRRRPVRSAVQTKRKAASKRSRS